MKMIDLHDVPTSDLIAEISTRTLKPGDVVDRSRNAVDSLRAEFLKHSDDQEHFVILFLSGSNSVITVEKLFTGSLTTSAIYPREVIKKILEYKAANVILAHNHPSGSLIPSNSDKAVTRKLATACNSIDVDVLDHIIIGGDGFFSFQDGGYSECLSH